MNKSKKQKAFNLSLTFGVLALLFACIFASFFVDTPNVLAYTDNSVSSTLIASDKNFIGSLYNHTCDSDFDSDNNTIIFKYAYRFTSSVEFDSILFNFCNYDGILDPIFETTTTISSFALNVAVDSGNEYDDPFWYTLPFMINLERPSNELFSYIDFYDGGIGNYGFGTYLITFDGSQEIFRQGNVVVYLSITFSSISSADLNYIIGKALEDDNNYKNTGYIQVLELGVIESNGSYNSGYQVGYNAGRNYSDQASYDRGYTAGIEAGGNIGSWLAGIGEAPLTLIKSLFNIEIFGINLNTIVFSLLGALVVIKLIRLFI